MNLPAFFYAAVLPGRGRAYASFTATGFSPQYFYMNSSTFSGRSK